MLSKLWGCSVTRIGQTLFLAIASTVVFAGLAWSADANKLISVSVDSGEVSPTILVETAEPVGYRYTVYDSFEPTRVVIDFPGMQLSDIDEKIAVNQGSVQEVRVAGFDLSSGQLARVEILLAETTDYQVNLDGKKFTVAFATEITEEQKATEPGKAVEPPVKTAVKVDAAKAASILSGVEVSSGKAVLKANGQLGKFQHFALGNPPRLVVDVYGLKPAFKERAFLAESGFDKIRIGTYNDKTRLVFDGSGKELPEHVVDGRNTDIIVTWSAAAPVEVKAPAAEKEVVSVKTAQPKPAPVPVVKPAIDKAAPVKVEAVDFLNEEGRSIIAVALSSAAKVSDPVSEGDLVRFEIENAKISRALRRTIDASAFPSAVTSVTPYTVTDGDKQNVRIAVDLKGAVAYALEQDGANVRLVIDDGAYAEAMPPAVSQLEVVAPEMTQEAMTKPLSADEDTYAPATNLVTADEMTAEATRYSGEKITLVFDSANVRSILQLIGDVSGLNILASGDVKGDVTLRLIDVPWDQALDLVLDTANLGKIQQGNVLRIMPKDKIREIEQADMKEQIVEMEEGVLETQLFPVSYASVDDMKGFLTDIKSDRGSIIADSRNKQLIIRDVAAVLEQMRDMISQIDKPERQVMIEARIVEADTNFSRDLGVKWGFNYDQTRGANATNPKLHSLAVENAQLGLGGSVISNPAAGAGIGGALAIGVFEDALNIDMRLRALETSGEGKIISTPRITTLNGESATISQGTKIPFSTVGDTGTDVSFENAELKLSVTPEINPDGSILLDIDASNSAVGSIVPTATGDAVSINEKKAQTKVLVRDGQTTVIGGIFIEDERTAETGVPILRDVPILGHLFKSSTVRRDRRELLIFITPRIVTP